MAQYVQYVDNDGNVNYNDYDYSKSVRPFWDGRRNMVGETPKIRVPSSKEQTTFPVSKETG